MNARHLIAAVATGTTLVVSAAPAFAGGEPKNEPPFTRPASDRAPAQIARLHANTQPPQGEPKNELPFTRPVEGSTVVVSSSAGGFDWTDAAIGAAAGLGCGLSLAGGIALVRGGTRGMPTLAH